MEENPPEVVVSDIMMPDQDGFSLQKILRQHPKWCHIPFIFLSALSEPDDVRAARELGCDEYLTKPFDPEDLRAVICGKAKIARDRQEKSAQELEGYRKRLVHTFSHEFRTPLVAINTGTELLKTTELEKEQFQKLLDSVHRGGLRLQRLVEDFMCLQQIENGSAGKVAERLRARLSLETVASEAVHNYLDSVQDRTLVIKIKSEIDEEVWIEAYEPQIQGIVGRLLSNAHKFGGLQNPVTLIVRATMDSASLIVRDHGPGMSEEVAKNACELFSQIDREKLEQQGCGIGLTIASHYASFNGGKIYFHNPIDGKGLAVELRLPRV